MDFDNVKAILERAKTLKGLGGLSYQVVDEKMFTVTGKRDVLDRVASITKWNLCIYRTGMFCDGILSKP